VARVDVVNVPWSESKDPTLRRATAPGQQIVLPSAQTEASLSLGKCFGIRSLQKWRPTLGQELYLPNGFVSKTFIFDKDVIFRGVCDEMGLISIVCEITQLTNEPKPSSFITCFP